MSRSSQSSFSARNQAYPYLASSKRTHIQTPSSVRSLKKQNRMRARSRAVSQVEERSVVPGNSHTDIILDDGEIDGNVMDEAIMAVDMHGRDTIGCAYFASAQETLYVLTDVKYGSIDIIDKLRQYVEPGIILISSRVDEEVEEHLQTRTRSREDLEDNYSPYVLDIRPSHEFNYDSAVRQLVDQNLELFQEAESRLVVPGDEDLSVPHAQYLEPGLSHVQGNILRLSAAIDLDSRLSISCVGAVLAYIQRRRAVVYLPGDSNATDMFKVTYLETFGLQNVMSLSSDTLIALQILRNEFHPHMHNQGPSGVASGSKEGLSVFGLFQNLACTPQGKSLLRQYFLRPSLDLQILANRHDTIKVFLLSENELLFQSIVKSLKHIQNMKATIRYLKKGVSNSAERGGGMRSSVWFRLRSFAYYALTIEQDIRSLARAEGLDIRIKIFDGFDRRALSTVGKAVIDVIDFSESQDSHRMVVLRGVDPNLDNMKRQYDGLEDMLNHVSQEIGQTIPQEFTSSLSIVFFPQIGFLIAMPVNPATEHEDYRDPGWEQFFYTTDRVYFKDFRMIELDNTIGDIYADIYREIEIVYDLAQRVLEHSDAIVRASEICAELDCLSALAQAAKMYGLTPPEMTDDNVIHIRGGWHIMQALVTPSCIANDLDISGGSGDATEMINEGWIRSQHSNGPPSVLFLTGPNYSGKSVFLRQNATIVYLAHVGSFVPASEARIGITDQLLTRISTAETVSRMQSAFFIDLQQVSSALYSMTRRSLLVIDEFGKGTNTSDGIGLMSGLLQYLFSLGDSRPKVMGATHLHEVFECGYVQEHRYLSFAYMEIRIDERASRLEDRIAYLYNLVPGRSTSSFGLMLVNQLLTGFANLTSCAAMNGIELGVTSRAEYLLKQQARGVDLADLCAGHAEQDRAELEQAEETARALLALELDNVHDTNGWFDILLNHGRESCNEAILQETFINSEEIESFDGTISTPRSMNIEHLRS